jgi:2-polyprenyl-3-methyl-5-hydroxy-6-metoxy-1,4-benzoquinol methylase
VPSRYERAVDPDTPNDARAIMVQMTGWNRRVLELGAASGYVTQALVERTCRVTAVEYDPEAALGLQGIAQEVLIADLNDPAALDTLSAEYDVVLAGDVLEHLLDPQALLCRVVGLLAPGGRVIVSVPNVAHIDVKLALLAGRWDYTETGLLDATHVRFYTLKSVLDTVARAGLVIIDLRRTTVAAFGTEVGVHPDGVPSEALAFALDDPEALTYQFIFTAVRDDGDRQAAGLAMRHIELQAQLNQIVREQRQPVDPTATGSLESARRVQDAEDRAAGAQRELDALRATKTFRLASGPRTLYRRLRAARPGG